MAGAPTNEEDKLEVGKKKKPFRPFSKKQWEEKVLTKLPTLKYGKGNNFVKSKTALSEVALEEYGDLGRLIRLEKYYVPVFVVPDYSGAGLTKDDTKRKINKKKTGSLLRCSPCKNRCFPIHFLPLQNKPYVADWVVDQGVVNATVRENKRMYTKEEVCRAKQAYKFLECSGYLSADETMHLITDGNVQGMPLFIKDDLERAYVIHGKH
jgi:hypothetical protein